MSEDLLFVCSSMNNNVVVINTVDNDTYEEMCALEAHFEHLLCQEAGWE